MRVGGGDDEDEDEDENEIGFLLSHLALVEKGRRLLLTLLFALM